MKLTDEEISTVVKRIIHEKLGIEQALLTDNADFKDDLHVDSLDLIELRMEIENTFSVSISDEEAEKLGTIGTIITFVKEKKR